jgi:4,5-dihydroxyphthalate decarboxylase
MHMVIIKRGIYEENPWVATSLFEAFELARQAGLERIQVTGPLAVALPWLPAHLEQAQALFGDRDAWAYGVNENRKEIDALIQYAAEQGVAARKVEIEELFAKETFVSPAIGRVA